MLLDIALLKDNEMVFQKRDIAGKLKDNILEFCLEEINHLINMEEKVFRRENEEFCFILNASTSSCTYELKSHQALFDIIVDSVTFLQDKHKLEIEYVIETDDQKNKIQITW